MVLPNFDSDEIWQPCPNRSTLKAKAKAKSKAKEVEVDLPEGLKVPKRGGVWQPASWCKLQVATFVGSTFFFGVGGNMREQISPTKKTRKNWRHGAPLGMLSVHHCLLWARALKPGWGYLQRRLWRWRIWVGQQLRRLASGVWKCCVWCVFFHSASWCKLTSTWFLRSHGCFVSLPNPKYVH